jgi:hypothetical protein
MLVASAVAAVGCFSHRADGLCGMADTGGGQAGGDCAAVDMSSRRVMRRVWGPLCLQCLLWCRCAELSSNFWSSLHSFIASFARATDLVLRSGVPALCDSSVGWDHLLFRLCCPACADIAVSVSGRLLAAMPYWRHTSRSATVCQLFFVNIHNSN